MTAPTQTPEGTQASDELSPGALVFVGACVAALTVPPAIFVFHLVAGHEDAVIGWGLASIGSLLIIPLLIAAMRSSRRDTRRLRALGVRGTATVRAVEPLEEDGYSALLWISVDGLEPFSARASIASRLQIGATVEVLVDPSDRLFTIVRSRATSEAEG